MNMRTISTKELRDEMPRIRAGLAKGNQYTVIYRSKPIAHLEPITSHEPGAPVRVKGGTLRLQAYSSKPLTPEYLNELAAKKYE
jgi:hypothetical protein